MLSQTAFYDTDMKYIFRKQENMLMTWKQSDGKFFTHSMVRVKWPLLIGVVVSNAGEVKIVTQKTS